jgi:hypothetical protein
MNGISVLIKETLKSQLIPSTMGDGGTQDPPIQQEHNYLWTRKWAWAFTRLYLSIGLSAFRTMGNKFLLCLNLQDYGVPLWQPRPHILASFFEPGTDLNSWVQENEQHKFPTSEGLLYHTSLKGLRSFQHLHPSVNLGSLTSAKKTLLFGPIISHVDVKDGATVEQTFFHFHLQVLCGILLVDWAMWLALASGPCIHTIWGGTLNLTVEYSFPPATPLLFHTGTLPGLLLLSRPGPRERHTDQNLSPSG